MSTNPEPTPLSNRSVPVTTLVLAVLLTAAATAVLVLAIVHFGERPPVASSTPGRNPMAPATLTRSVSEDRQDDVPFSQQGSVKPEGELTGIVYYPIPYATPPNLSLSPGRRYAITKQDEFSFVWLDREAAKELPALAADVLKDVPALAGVLQKKPAEASPAEKKTQDAPAAAGEQPEMTWEAKGVRAAADSRALRLFEQKGTFYSLTGSEGEVMFPYPYASPPNVELSGPVHTTLIVEIKATGFKWKNGGTAPFDRGDAGWTAKGIKATEVPK